METRKEHGLQCSPHYLTPLYAETMKCIDAVIAYKISLAIDISMPLPEKHVMKVYSMEPPDTAPQAAVSPQAMKDVVTMRYNLLEHLTMEMQII
ncbi:TPA: hypothetical protein DCZ39_07090 [Patescibacteria group bacterium]|nr:hypothetical protein [Candidatus Gracilibacteria bacterium]